MSFGKVKALTFIYILHVLIISSTRGELSLYEKYQEKLNNVSERVEKRYNEKYSPLYHSLLKETANLLDEDEAYIDPEESEENAEVLESNYGYAEEYPEAQSKQWKRDLNSDAHKKATSVMDQLKQTLFPSYLSSPESLISVRATNSSNTSLNQTPEINNDQNKWIDNKGKSNESEVSECSHIIDPTNATAVLEKVLEELDIIRTSKQGNSTPEGSDCEIEGSWNSEISGLRFDLNFSYDHSIHVVLADKIPQKHTYKMDKTWNCTGFSVKKIGGPFYLACMKKPDSMLTLFTGICKNYGGYNTIFGSWNFAHVPKDFQDLHTFVETRNDVFRRETLHLKKIQKSFHKDVIQQTTEDKHHFSNKTRRNANYFRSNRFN